MSNPTAPEFASINNDLQECRTALEAIHHFYDTAVKNRRIFPSENFIADLKREENAIEQEISRLEKFLTDCLKS